MIILISFLYGALRGVGADHSPLQMKLILSILSGKKFKHYFSDFQLLLLFFMV